MNILLGLIIYLINLNSYALDAVVTVLEAPLFKEKNTQSPVVQYFRRGDIIKIHPGIGQNKKYDHLSPGYEKFQNIKKELSQNPEAIDPLLDGTVVEEISPIDEFIPTLDRQGKTAYILSDHIQIYFDDEREFSLNFVTKDRTDYRLNEPLPDNYPLFTKTGYRGNILMGISQPYNESYSYPEQISTKVYSNPFEISAAFLNQTPDDVTDRFYFGGTLRFRTYENNFVFNNQRNTSEKYYQFGLGPNISFDAYKGQKNRLNLSYSILFNPFNSLKISQQEGNTSETKNFKGIGFSTRFGVYYHRKSIAENLDFVAGPSLDFEPSMTYESNDKVSEQSWWKKLKGEKFSTRSYIGLTVSIGLQAAY